MDYLWEKAFKRVRKNKKKYIALFVQIVLGMCMLSVSLNATISAQRQMQSFQKKYHSPYGGILSWGNTGQNAVTDEDWQYIRSRYGEQGISMYKQYGVSDGCSERFYVLFADTQFYSVVMGMTQAPEENSVYIGKNAKAYLDSASKMQDTNLETHYSEKEKTLFDREIASFLPLKMASYNTEILLSDVLYVPGAIVATSFDDVIIFPASTVQLLPVSTHIIFPLVEGTREKVSESLLEIRGFLKEMHPQVEYELKDYYAQISMLVNRNQYVVQLLLFLSVFTFFIIVFGLVGLLLVFINKRKKEIAVSLMCGARHGQIILETFLEILAVVSGSTVIGNLCSILFLPSLSGFAVKTEYSVLSLLLCTMGAVFLSSLVCSLALRKIKRITPIQVRKGV